MIQRGSGQASQPIAERAVAPHQLVAIEPSSHGNDLSSERAELMDSILERRGDANPVTVKAGNVVDAIFQGAIAEHVVDEAADRDGDAVACLLDALDVALHATVDHFPHASQVGGAIGQRLSTTVECSRGPDVERGA